MTKAIRIHETGGPEVLKWEDVAVGDPQEGEIRVRHTAVGLNFIDVYFRSGLYPGPALPFSIGLEACGVVEAVGAGVTELKAGDRIAYAAPPIGAYAEARVMPAAKAVKVPDGIEDQQAAAMMLQGMTAEYLLRRCYPVKKGQTVLYHAAAGGVGLIFCQWAKHLGVTVIGTVSSDEKAELAKAHGCTHPVIYTRDNFVDKVKELTGGKGVPVVYDGVGKTTFMDSLDCLSPRGTMVTFGQSSGAVEPLNTGLLSQKGSLYLTRPTLMTYTASREDTLESSGALFDVVKSGAVKIEVNQTFALKDAADAHRALEGRKTTGSTVLLP